MFVFLELPGKDPERTVRGAKPGNGQKAVEWIVEGMPDLQASYQHPHELAVGKKSYRWVLRIDDLVGQTLERIFPPPQFLFFAAAQPLYLFPSLRMPGHRPYTAQQRRHQGCGEGHRLQGRQQFAGSPAPRTFERY